MKQKLIKMHSVFIPVPADHDHKKWQYMQKTVQKCVLRSSMQFKTTKFTFQNAKYALDIILDAVSNSDQCSTSF